MNAARQFRHAARAAAQDAEIAGILRFNIATYDAAVALGRGRFLDWREARRRAEAIKRDAIAQLDRYLEEFERRIIARGAAVHWAPDAAAAREIILEIARRHNVRRVVKSKSMVSEEIHLREALEQAGMATLETDLGEYIVQLRNEPPYHIVTPAMHLRREHIAGLFHQKLGTPADETSPEALVRAARREMRQRFVAADLGITGANFLIADHGLVAITENEGNARLCASLPPVQVVLTGIEKLLPRLADLALFWPLLATAGTGQPITCYNSLLGGPRRGGEPDGPRELHIVLLDNGRSRVLADAAQRELLHCIRCGACLNACPVFQTIGGHAYATTYPGPIGAALTPLLRGPAYDHLAYATSLCGACAEACPVGIEIHHQLLRDRAQAAAARRRPWSERLEIRALAWAAAKPRRFERAGRLARRLLRLRPQAIDGTRLDPLRPWTRYRQAPEPPPQSFRAWWRQRNSPPAPNSMAAEPPS